MLWSTTGLTQPSYFPPWNPISPFAKSSTEKRIIPNFLIDKNNSTEDIESLLTGLKLLSDYLEKSILKPNNLN